MELTPPPAGRWNDLPEDVAVAVASRLEADDVCALGSCSRSWLRACAADCVWARLFRRRWPAAAAAAGAWEGTSGVDVGKRSKVAALDVTNANLMLEATEGWKVLYRNHHRRTAAAISSVVELVEGCTRNGSLEVEYYLKAINDLASMDVGFIDVQFFLFSRKLSVILNLVGLHFSITFLQVPLNEVGDALQACHVAERQVCVSLFKLGRWFYGFRLPDEDEKHQVSLSELTMAKGEDVLAILNRGAVHEVFRVQVSLVMS